MDRRVYARGRETHRRQLLTSARPTSRPRLIQTAMIKVTIHGGAFEKGDTPPPGMGFLFFSLRQCSLVDPGLVLGLRQIVDQQCWETLICVGTRWTAGCVGRDVMDAVWSARGGAAMGGSARAAITREPRHIDFLYLRHAATMIHRHSHYMYLRRLRVFQNSANA